MNDCLQVNPAADFRDLRWAMEHRVHQARSILRCLVADDSFRALDADTLAACMGVAEQLLGEVEALRQAMIENARQMVQEVAQA